MQDDINSFNKIYNSLSEEEKILLESIEAKMTALIEEEKQNKHTQLEALAEQGADFSTKHPDIIHSKHITRFPREIVFSIRAEVTQLDDKGNLASVVELIEKFYHIPVHAEQDHNLYVDNFFNNFHKTLEKTCKILNKFNEQQQ